MSIIVTELLGGLGNQLFQYAIARSISEKNKIPFYLCTSHFNRYTLRRYELGNYRIIENFVHQKDLDQFGLKYRFKDKNFAEKVLSRLFVPKPALGYREFREKQDYVFDESVMNLSGNVYLSGYWQSPKYFDSIKDLLIQEFTLKKQPHGLNEHYIKIFKSKRVASVHVRRGDYVTNAEALKFHGTPSIEYYDKAAKLLMTSVKPELFAVFSDDIEWCKANLKLPAETAFIEHNSGSDGHEDIRLMQHCQAHVIANSTFSWWGAWLAGDNSKMVIAPSRWTLKFADEKIDIYPDSWIKI